MNSKHTNYKFVLKMTFYLEHRWKPLDVGKTVKLNKGHWIWLSLLILRHPKRYVYCFSIEVVFNSIKRACCQNSPSPTLLRISGTIEDCVDTLYQNCWKLLKLKLCPWVDNFCQVPWILKDIGRNPCFTDNFLTILSMHIFFTKLKLPFYYTIWK